MNAQAIMGILALAGLALLAGFAAPRLRRTSLDKNYFRKRWQNIQNLLKTPEGQQLAIIEADKLLDEALQKLRFSGKTMGERLVSAQRNFSSTNNVWTAHKLRNRIVHEPSVRLNKRQLQVALSAFRSALKDLGAL